MKIIIKKLSISNFKGIRSLDISFRHVTDIFGENAAGKTTIFDAFTWLFFGKDSTDRKDFELKPLDKNGKVVSKVDVEVSAIIDVDGKEITIRRLQREKWTKKRGSLNTEFEGNENLFYWNDVPLQLKQFTEKINALLNENIFKLITNALYFNSLKWQERRRVLMEIAGTISNDDLVAINPDFKSLIKLLGDKTLDEYKREISVKKKKIKDDLQAIPIRISEINQGIPEEADFEAIRALIESKLEDLEAIDTALQSSVKSLQVIHDMIRQKQNTLHELKTKSLNLKNDLRSTFADAHQERKNAIAALQREISDVHSAISNKAYQIKNSTTEISRIELEKAGVARDWETESAKELVFNDDQFNCPSCNRLLEADQIQNSKETITGNFNTNKANSLKILLEKGTGLKNRIADLNIDLSHKNAEHTDLQNQLLSLQLKLDEALTRHQSITANSEAEFNIKLSEHAEFTGIAKKIADLEKELSAPVNENDNSELKSRKSIINIEVDALKKQLTNEDRIKQCRTRIEQLESEEKILAQQLADLEASEFLTDQFTKAKMDTLVSRINGRFSYVTFKLFDQQINGGEVECCDTLVNGVPFSDANNAARINAGVDIINTLCDHYGVYAPIFIDNRESINNLIECNSQVVNLIVSKDKKLRVA